MNTASLSMKFGKLCSYIQLSKPIILGKEHSYTMGDEYNILHNLTLTVAMANVNTAEILSQTKLSSELSGISWDLLRSLVQAP